MYLFCFFNYSVQKNVSKFNVGDLVLVKSKEFDNFCRGRIRQHLNSYLVQLIDYGNLDWYDNEDLHELPKELQEV